MDSNLGNRVLIVDDDELVQAAIKCLLKTVGIESQALSSAAEFESEIISNPPDVVILDIRLPGKSGLELLREQHHRKLDFDVIAISAYGEVSVAVEIMRLGAVDFLQKPFRDQLLIDRVQESLVASKARRDRRAAESTLALSLSNLTPRERDIVNLLRSGRTPKEIATILNISPKTVYFHQENLMRKWSCRSISELLSQIVRLP